MFEALGKNWRNVRSAVRSIRMQVKSGGAPPQSKTLRATAKFVRARAHLKCAGAGTLRAARLRGPFVRSYSSPLGSPLMQGEAQKAPIIGSSLEL